MSRLRTARRTRRVPERRRADALEATHVPPAGLRHGRESAAIRAAESASHGGPDSCADHGTLFAAERRPGASAIGSATRAGADGPSDTSRRVTPVIRRRRPRARLGLGLLRWYSLRDLSEALRPPVRTDRSPTAT